MLQAAGWYQDIAETFMGVLADYILLKSELSDGLVLVSALPPQRLRPDSSFAWIQVFPFGWSETPASLSWGSGRPLPLEDVLLLCP